MSRVTVTSTSYEYRSLERNSYTGILVPVVVLVPIVLLVALVAPYNLFSIRVLIPVQVDTVRPQHCEYKYRYSYSICITITFLVLFPAGGVLLGTIVKYLYTGMVCP
jgi:hypothetical protein